MEGEGEKRPQMRRCKSGKRAIVKSKTDYTADKCFDEYFKERSRRNGGDAEKRDDAGKTRPRRKETSQVANAKCQRSMQSEKITE